MHASWKNDESSSETMRGGERNMQSGRRRALYACERNGESVARRIVADGLTGAEREEKGGKRRKE